MEQGNSTVYTQLNNLGYQLTYTLSSFQWEAIVKEKMDLQNKITILEKENESLKLKMDILEKSKNYDEKLKELDDRLKKLETK